MLNEAPAEGTSCTEIDSLDQVIMAAALVEKAEAQNGSVQLGQIQLCLSDDVGAVNNNDVVMLATSVSSGNSVIQSQITSKLSGLPAAGRVVKLADDDKTGRRFVCGICKNRFKEVLPYFSAHILVFDLYTIPQNKTSLRAKILLRNILFVKINLTMKTKKYS